MQDGHGGGGHSGGGDHSMHSASHFDAHHGGPGAHGDSIGHVGHELSISNVGELGGHFGVATDGLIFRAALNWVTGHGGDHGYSISHDPSGAILGIGPGVQSHTDGVGGGTGRGIRGSTTKLSINAVDVSYDDQNQIIFVHAMNIGYPDLVLLLNVWPAQLGLVNVTNQPNYLGVGFGRKVDEAPVDECLSWDWSHPNGEQMPPGYLPGVICKTTRIKRYYQIGKANPKLSWWRQAQLYLKVGAPPTARELVANQTANTVIELYAQQWQYKQLGTAEVKLEFRVRRNLRWYQATSRVPSGWHVVRAPFIAHKIATLVLARRLYKEMNETNRTPGMLEDYLAKLRQMPGNYQPPVYPDGITPGTRADEEALEEADLGAARDEDRVTDAQLPTTLPPGVAPLPPGGTTPATPTFPGGTVDGLPPAPGADTGSAIGDTGSAIDGVPGVPPPVPVPVPTQPVGVASASPPSASLEPGAALLPAAQGTQTQGFHPVTTVTEDGTVVMRVPISDFRDFPDR